MKEELMTEGQKARCARNCEIVKAYVQIRKEQPLVTRNRVLEKLAVDFGLVSQTVKNILRKADAY